MLARFDRYAQRDAAGVLHVGVRSGKGDAASVQKPREPPHGVGGRANAAAPPHVRAGVRNAVVGARGTGANNDKPNLRLMRAGKVLCAAAFAEGALQV